MLQKLFKKRAIYLGLALIFIAVLWNEGPGLRWEPEGLYMQKNFRDVGDSINSCLSEDSQQPLFKTNVFLRSNRWFSGWSCDSVGDPEAIISLNYQPERNRKYFCWKGIKKVVGDFAASDTEINNIEFYDTWFKEEQRKPICTDLISLLHSLGEGKRSLIHCDAGRDRTGAIAGIVTALALETAQGSISSSATKAIECDYRKSASLSTNKYGRLHNFIAEVQKKKGSMANFLHDRCGINFALVESASKSLLINPTKPKI